MVAAMWGWWVLLANAALLEGRLCNRCGIPGDIGQKRKVTEGLRVIGSGGYAHPQKKMYELCDAAIILPRRIWHAWRVFEMITWNNLNIHDKRYFFILNTDGFYNHLLEHFTMMGTGISVRKSMERITVADCPEELLKFSDSKNYIKKQVLICWKTHH